MRFSKINLFLLLSISLLLGACVPGFVPAPTEDIQMLQTAVAQTVEVRLTQDAFATLIAQPTQTIEATQKSIPDTPVPPTETLLPTATFTLVATNTPLPTSIPPTPTSTPIPCDWVGFVSDVTVADNTVFSPSDSFVKTWRLKNIGSCTWTTDYDLVFISGNAMNGPATQSLNRAVLPGETVDISINLVAPDSEGTYTGYWRLRNANNAIFGIGANAEKSFWVQIKVSEEESKWDSDDPLDFVAAYCKASWRSTEGVLPCPSPIDDFSNGSITRTSAPKLEGGYQDDEPTLIMIPSAGDGGMIYGRYPEIKIKAGDHFTALTGCLDSSPKCDVMFRVNYIADGGSIQSLKNWTEVSDGKYTRVDIDLSSLAGKEVELILRVENNDSSKDDRAFWMAPIIKR